MDHRQGARSAPSAPCLTSSFYNKINALEAQWGGPRSDAETPCPRSNLVARLTHASIEGRSDCIGQSLKHGGRAVEQDRTYVAFDTTKETLAVAMAENGQRQEVYSFGTIANRAEAVRSPQIPRASKQRTKRRVPSLKKRI